MVQTARGPSANCDVSSSQHAPRCADGSAGPAEGVSAHCSVDMPTPAEVCWCRMMGAGQASPQRRQETGAPGSPCHRREGRATPCVSARATSTRSCTDAPRAKRVAARLAERSQREHRARALPPSPVKNNASCAWGRLGTVGAAEGRRRTHAMAGAPTGRPVPPRCTRNPCFAPAGSPPTQPCYGCVFSRRAFFSIARNVG